MHTVPKKRPNLKAQRLLYLALARCLEERDKERVGAQWSREELGVELGTQEEWVHALGEFGDFHQLTRGRPAREYEASLLELLDVLWVHFVAVSVAL